MRLSSIVSLVVVTASLALGGCAADAEPASGGGTDNPNVALSDPTQNVNQGGRTGDVRLIGRVTDVPSGFNGAPTEKIGVTPPAFRYVSPGEVGATTDIVYLPFSDTKKDVP
jgi:hypothetical protein